MIHDSIKNLKLYTGLGTDFKVVYDFITGSRFDEKTPTGHYDLANGVYYMVQNYETRPETGFFFETHRKYIDLQYVVRGKERHDVIHVSALKEHEPYNAEKDMEFFDGKGNTLILNHGFFAIYFPDDAHKPNLRTDSVPEKIVKVVFKIPVK